MPRSNVDLRTFGPPGGQPVYAPWGSMADPARNLVVTRTITDSQLQRLQHLAQCCSTWAAWRGTCGLHSLMLAAGTLSIDRLIEFLDDVSGEICSISYDPEGLLVPITKQGRVDSRSKLFALLDAVADIRAVVAGQEEHNSIEFPDEYVTFWRDGSFEEVGVVDRALGHDFVKVRKSLQGLPSDIRLLARLRDSANQVCLHLKATIQKAIDSSPGALAAEQKQVLRSLGEVRSLGLTRNSRGWHWCSVTAELMEAIDAWKSKTWTGGHGHKTNQWLRSQLRRDVAFLRQYAILMRATAQRHRMLLRLDALFALVREINACAMKIRGPLSSPCPADIANLFKVDIVEPEWRERWSSTLGPDLKKAKTVIGMVLKGGQQEPWLVGKFMDKFLRAGLVGKKKKGEENRMRRIVDEVLVPMQSVGLAAQVPWSELLAVPRKRRRKNDAAFKPDWAAKMAKGYRGKKWVVNPFGACLRWE